MIITWDGSFYFWLQRNELPVGPVNVECVQNTLTTVYTCFGLNKERTNIQKQKNKKKTMELFKCSLLMHPMWAKKKASNLSRHKEMPRIWLRRLELKGMENHSAHLNQRKYIVRLHRTGGNPNLQRWRDLSGRIYLLSWFLWFKKRLLHVVKFYCKNKVIGGEARAERGRAQIYITWPGLWVFICLGKSPINVNYGQLTLVVWQLV